MDSDYPLKQKLKVSDDERLLVVDRDDHVIGVSTRANLHRKRQWHRQVYVFLVNAEQEVLIQMRGALAQFDSGKWTASVSGHVREDEVYLAAARRELQEEIGVSLSELEYLGKTLAYSESHGEVCGGPSAVFMAAVGSEVDVVARLEEEVAQVAWFAMQSIAEAVACRLALECNAAPVEFASDFAPVFEVLWNHCQPMLRSDVQRNSE